MPREDTQFKPGQPKPPGSGTKRGYKYLRPLLLAELKKQVKDGNETLAQRLIKNLVATAINDVEAPILDLIFKRIDGNDLNVSFENQEISAEKSFANKVNKLNAKDKQRIINILEGRNTGLGQAGSRVSHKKSPLRKSAVSKL